MDEIRTYKYWDDLFKANQLDKFNYDKFGLLWLKIKAINRKENQILAGFCDYINYSLHTGKLSDTFPELYAYLATDCDDNLKKLDAYLLSKEIEIEKEINQENLIKQLYNVNYFRWSSGNNNDLGKSLIERYVKHNPSYDYLVNELDKGIAIQVKDYLICTWYNHWTSIIIENIFKSSNKVVSAIGRVKSVDFFIDNIPFDLKVTHLPQNFIDVERSKIGLKNEIASIKKIAKEFGIDASLNIETIIRMIKDNHDAREKYDCDIVKFRKQIIASLNQNALPLELNLYEQQGAFRFGAENRLFLVLIDSDNYEDSWQLKRNMNLLRPKIMEYLHHFDKNDITKLKFTYEGKDYSVLCDTLIIEK